MLEFSDLLYGRITLPEWISPFLRIPEFIRLRGVRLSNVDSYEFKDFSGPNRWDHGVAVAALACRCATRARLDQTQTAHLVLAALLHDVATPPFAHTAEYVVENFDHEVETQRLLTATFSEYSSPDLPIYASELPAFKNACLSLGKKLRVAIDADEVAAMITGGGELGYLVSGTLDLDNADNVTRSCVYLGIEVDRTVPLRLADWLATQKSAPTGLDQVSDPAVQQWLAYRSELYRMFFESSDQETGRQAFLQHLIRRALRTSVPRSQILWTTDDGLLRTISDLDDSIEVPGWASLRQMTQRYRLMEETVKIAEIAITDPETLRVLRVPQAATWIERELSTPDLEPFVMVSARRFGGASSPIHLLPPPIGALSVFKIGALPKYFHFPDWMRADIPRAIEGRRLISAVHETLERKVHAWAKDRPWLKNSARRERDVAENLKSIGDWSFRLSKNEGLHPYPGTFVHAIPSALIGALGLKGAVVLDPFGGTGQTASEVIKSGGTAISADSNSVATLIARAKLTYLSREQRDIIRSIRLDELRLARAVTPPSVELIGKWHHPDTIAEICQIKGFIDAHTDATVRQLLLAALSAVLPATTARKGKEHGFFADNTPLGAAYTEPPYQPAYIPFLQRVLRNLDLIDKLYASIEANGRVPEEELSRASILRADSRIADAATYNISPNSVDAIITSPPYLCMVDYSLGQRLSYYWLDPDRLELDFSHEIGARRRRSNPVSARNKYLDDLRAVAKNASNLLREGGYFATVLGAPVANAFLADRDMHDAYDEILREAGFSLLWKHWRDIHWHRNHGYQRLRQERISVHVLKGG